MPVKATLLSLRMVLLMVTLLLCPLPLLLAQAQLIEPSSPGEHAFVIVIDPASYTHAQEAVYAYRHTVEADGLATYIMVDAWQDPVHVRESLIALHTQDPGLEGAVFMGDIPIAMIRQGQHLTTAFKMDEDRWPVQRSSVPSDRFYDDFDLVFEFLFRDEEDELLHYYRLSEQSPQEIRSDIYSGRIKPPRHGDTPAHEWLSDYLFKVVADRQAQNRLQHLFAFLGHGSNSGCRLAWASEMNALHRQFPGLNLPGHSLKFMKYHMHPRIKHQVMNELQRPELDVATLSMHGSPGIQHLGTAPAIIERKDILAHIQGRIHHILHQAEGCDSLARTLSRRRGIPEEWTAQSELPANFQPDTLGMIPYEIHLDDVATMLPGARLMILDACFNGAFIHDEFMAGAYLFNQGQTLVTVANSVNVLQDIWANEFLGLLGLGVRIGHIRQAANTLESHIFGDPSFRFYAAGGDDLNLLIASGRHDGDVWETLLLEDHPDLIAYALRRMSHTPSTDFSGLLFDEFTHSPHGTVRLEAFRLLAGINDHYYEQALALSLEDPHEMIRRLGASWMGMKGHPDHIAPLVRFAIQEPAYVRAAGFQARNAFRLFHPDALQEEINRQFDQMRQWPDQQALQEEMASLVERYRSWSDESVQTITNRELSDGQRIQSIRMLRNMTYHHHLRHFLQIAADPSESPAVRMVMIEALGWFRQSVGRSRIEERMLDIVDDPRTPPPVRREAIKTLNRL